VNGEHKKGGIILLHHYDNIPEVLKVRPNWVVWGINGAPIKSPFNPESLLAGNPMPAKAGVSGTWGSYHNAVKCVRRGLAQGIGYEFDGMGIYGIDLDNVLYGGELIDRAKNIVRNLSSYTEISPSRNGLHIYVYAPSAQITRHRKKDCFLEVYGEGRYFTVTGNIFGSQRGVNNRTRELQAVHDKFLLPVRLQKVAAFLPSVSENQHAHFLHLGLARDKVFAAMWAGQRSCGNESSDDIALINKLAYWCNADIDAIIKAFLSSPYYAQKDEAHKIKCCRYDYLPETVQNACDSLYSTAEADNEKWEKKQERINR